MVFPIGSFLGGVAAATEKNTELQMQYGYRNAQLDLAARKYALEYAQFTHTTQKDLADKWGRDFDTLLAVGAKGQESGAFANTPGSREAFIQRLDSAARRAAGPLANITLGEPGTPGMTKAEHYDEMLNRAYGTLTATPDPQHLGIADGLKEYYKQRTGNDLGTAAIAGKNKGQEAFSAATGSTAPGSGAAASAITAGAEASQRPLTVTPEQGIKFPPLSPALQSLPGMPSSGGPAVASPTQGVVTPQPPAIATAPPGGAASMGAMPAPQAQPGAGGYAVAPAMTPEQYQARTEIGKQFGSEKEQHAYQVAGGTLQSLYSMWADADAMQRAGAWTAPGPMASLRNKIGMYGNTISQGLGGEPIINPNAIASWQDLTKETSRMGMQLISSMYGGQREGQMVVMKGIGAVPHDENSILGFRLVSSGIEQETLRRMELHDAIAKSIDSGQSAVQAASQFEQTHPPGVYTMRAIANAVPDELVALVKQNPQVYGPRLDSDFNAPWLSQFILSGARTGFGAAGGFSPGAGMQ